MKVTQHLWFEKDMEAAIGFYTSLVQGSSIQWVSALPVDSPSGPAGPCCSVVPTGTMSVGRRPSSSPIATGVISFIRQGRPA